METFIIVAYIIGGILGLWLTILGLAVGHRFLSYHPAQPSNVTDADWRMSRLRAAGAFSAGPSAPEPAAPLGAWPGATYNAEQTPAADKPLKKFEDRFMTDDQIAERDGK